MLRPTVSGWGPGGASAEENRVERGLTKPRCPAGIQNRRAERKLQLHAEAGVSAILAERRFQARRRKHL